MPTLWIDTETRSRNNILNGSYLYAEDSSCLLVTYAIDEGPVQVWEVVTGKPMPADLRKALADEMVTIVAWNASFDRTQIAAWVEAFPDQGWPLSAGTPWRWLDAMTVARMAGLPGGLEDVCAALGLPEQYAKKDGKDLIKKFCVPSKTGAFVDPRTSLLDWARFIEYAKFDIVSMREVMARIPNMMTPMEADIYAYTELMNDRGLPIDRRLAVSAMHQSEVWKERYAKQAKVLVDDESFNIASQRAVLDLLKSYGIVLEDARSATLEDFLDSPMAEALPSMLREVLVTRLKSNKSAVTKYAGMVKRANTDDRVRGTIVMYGANRTGRDSARGFQSQNLARAVLLNDKLPMEWACEIVKAGTAELYFEDPLQLLSDTVRGTIMAPEGSRLAIADLSNIEGRVCPWLANEESKLQYFRDFDAGRIKFDNYVMAYAKSFNVKPEDVTKENRQVGKVSELACFGADTRVLTDNGVKRIVDVAINDKLWDGEEWVSHQGVVYKGQRETLNLMGTTVTADHLILVDNRWVEAGVLASSKKFRGLALAKGLENLPSLATPLIGQTQNAPSENLRFSVHAAGSRTVSICTTSFVAKLLSAKRAALKLLWGMLKSSGNTQNIALTMNTAGAYSIGWLRAKVDAITPTTLVTLTTGVGAYTSMRHGKKIKPTSYATSLLWMAGTTLNWNSTAPMSTKGMNRETCGLLASALTHRTDEKSERCKTTFTNSKPVYDILNSGSRNRFTVITDEGPIIAHNCQYGGSVGAYMTFATAFRLDIEQLGLGIAENVDPRLLAECESQFKWSVDKGITTYGLEERVWAGLMAGVKSWRLSHPNIVSSWAKAEEAFRAAIKNPGEWIPMAREVFVNNANGTLFVRLPSGRTLLYPSAHEVETKDRRAKTLSFYGVRPMSRKFDVIRTHGARLIENLTQAMARDCLFYHIPEVERAGYRIIMRVHDELVAEIEDPRLSGEHLATLVGRPHSWCQDLPMAAKGATTVRYDK